MYLNFDTIPARVANGPHFEARTWPEPDIFLKPDLGPKNKFAE